ncbi:hypothetical protein OF83DRAFT_837728 [Amylostereum chailletii]|nr:hypothetical protein OF83DRAFT_837728 [Amylostereum chailletii]
MRARKAVKAITPQVDVIDISSDEDELVLKSPEPRKTNKARPKPRPVKRAKVADPHPADVSITESEATIPVPSSSFPMVPPSDPLPSSSAPRPSSPRSLIRDSPVPELSSLSSTSSSKKRKRSSRIVDESDNEGDGVGAVDRDSALMPPPAVPPLFFADSSGSVEVPEASAPPSKKSKKGEKKAKKAGEEGAKKPKAKPGKRKQKSTVQVVIEPSRPSSTDKTRDNDVVMEDCGTSAPTMQPAARRPSPMDFRGSLSPVPNSEDEDELQLIPPSAARKQPPAPKEVAQKSKSNKGKATNNNDGIGDGVKKSRKKVAKKAVIPDDDEGEAAGEDVVSTTVSDGNGKSKDHTPIGETDGEAESEIPSRTKVKPSRVRVFSN